MKYIEACLITKLAVKRCKTNFLICPFSIPLCACAIAHTQKAEVMLGEEKKALKGV